MSAYTRVLGELSGPFDATHPPRAVLGVDLRPRIALFGPLDPTATRVTAFAGEVEVTDSEVNSQPSTFPFDGQDVLFQPGELLTFTAEATGRGYRVLHLVEARYVHTQGEVDTDRFEIKRTETQGS